MRLHRLIPALALTCVLAACAQLPAVQPDAGLPTPRAARQDTDDFFLTGRIAVSQGQQRHAVNITWQHSATRDEILLATPLGQGIAELVRDDAGAHLTTAERREFHAPDLRTLSIQVFGFALPLSALPRWLLAEVPAQALGVYYDRLGRPQRMIAEDWQVAYPEYTSDAIDALPALIELKHEDVEVRVKVDAWQPPR